MIRYSTGQEVLGGGGDSGGAGGGPDITAVHWKGPWQAQTYAKNDQVDEDNFIGIANKGTTGHAAPQYDGPFENDLIDSPAWQELAEVGEVVAGHQYVFNRSGFIQQIEMRAPESSSFLYRPVLIDSSDPTKLKMKPLMSFPGGTDDWVNVDLDERLVSSGDTLRIYLQTLNKPDVSSFNFNWQYQGQANNAPNFGQWTRNAGNTEVNINFFDFAASGTDRSADLAELTAGDTLTITHEQNPANNFVYTVVSSQVIGQYYKFTVTVASQSGNINNGNTCSVVGEFEGVAGASVLTLPNHWATPANQPDWAAVNGVIFVGGVPSVNDNAYGVRLQFQPAIESPDWDLLPK